jgi:molecular chaperone GrpE
MTKKTEQTEEIIEVEEPTEEVFSDTPDYRDLWQRALADHDNLRKRLEVDRQNSSKFALSGFMEELLPVVDNFYRATEHVSAEQQNSSWVAGVLYIQKQLLDVLSQEGLTEIPAKVGDHFDPAHHEAIGTAHDEKHLEDTIIEIKNKGYQLHDRMLRAAQVIVNK